MQDVQIVTNEVSFGVGSFAGLSSILILPTGGLVRFIKQLNPPMPPSLPDLHGPAGAMFTLRKPATQTLVIEHVDGEVTTRAGSPCVTVKLSAPVSSSKLRDLAWRVVQEAFDIRAATHRDAISTYRGDHEYALWTLGSAGYDLVIVDTIHSQWNMTATLSVGGNPSIPPPPQSVPYHPSLRFYRLSQLSEDLFDAYRNAYLALECIISDESPKKSRESEPDWLKRVLQGPLATSVPGGISIPITVDAIYKLGRLPLFHAKTGNLFYVPQGVERGEIQASLDTLHRLLASIMKIKLSPLIAGSWGQMSQQVVDTMGRVSFNADEIVYRHGLHQQSVNVAMQVVDTPRRFGNLWAYVITPVPTELSALEAIVFRTVGNETISLTVPELIPLCDVCTVRIELNQLTSNVRATTPLHPT